MPTSFETDLQGRIARLFIHPVKSCAALEVSQARLTATGLEWDRAWMVVDAQGEFLSQRSLPRMALIRPQLGAQTLTLMAPGAAPLSIPFQATGPVVQVRVWKDSVPAWDMGDGAAQWFSAFLGQACRLVRFDPAQRRLSSMDWTGGVEAANQFSDGYPILLASEASLAELNQRLTAAGHHAVGMERFRANVVLAGGESHDEDRVDLLRIRVDAGEVHLQPVKPCARCPIPDIDPATAESHPAVGDTLRTYRQDARVGGGITFGMNAITRQGVGAVLRVGQPWGADLRFD